MSFPRPAGTFMSGSHEHRARRSIVAPRLPLPGPYRPLGRPTPSDEPLCRLSAVGPRTFVWVAPAAYRGMQRHNSRQVHYRRPRGPFVHRWLGRLHWTARRLCEPGFLSSLPRLHVHVALGGNPLGKTSRGSWKAFQDVYASTCRSFNVCSRAHKPGPGEQRICDGALPIVQVVLP